MVAISDLVRYRRSTERLVERSGRAHVPTRHGEFDAVAYTSLLDRVEHLALVLGDVTGDDGVLVRVHSECLTGDVLGSLRCDCGTQLELSLEAISAAGGGVLVYLRGHEGEGIGLGHKLRAYALQESGYDTVDANLGLGLPVDSREYGVGAHPRRPRGAQHPTHHQQPAEVHRAQRLRPRDRRAGPLPTVVTPQNLAYLRTKRDRMGDHITVPADGPAASSPKIRVAAFGSRRIRLTA